MQEIWAIDQEKELLSFFYPRLKQYYEFYSGRLGSSTTRKFDSNLLSPFDYFYNSGGWDDYPAQVYTHQERLGNQVAPIINTAQCIRIAKIMSLFAVILNQEQDCVLFEDDIKLMTKDLYDYAWDEDSGYFGYVYHDKTLKPKGILRTDAGINFNMGLDGLYPLVAGICNEKIEQNFVEKLMDEKHYFTKIGLTTVDMQAPYYNESGYWNGAVWMPHQYYFWKTMLDLGRYQEAFEIADRALETWKAEVDASYNCFEHFVVNSGRGAGWHQFSGLSTPVVVWFKAYYGHGTVSTGFDLMVTEKNTTNNNTEMFLRMISSNDRKTSTVIVNMNPAFEYEVKVNDTQVQVFRLFGGCLNIQVVNDIKDKLLELKIKKRDER
nr:MULTISPECIES: trehalase family glycosidase [unclassified Fusibacter]